ncbi:hypothetical protein [Niallia sp. 03190]|uniref:hypothetical protein n=1 Tax=Niallia sp. 03190 TaxID=3458061 RepID=UPI004043F594
MTTQSEKNVSTPPKRTAAPPAEKPQKQVIKKVEKTLHEIRQEAEVKSVIYCGPTLPNHALLQYSTFTGDLPPHVQEHIEKCPAIMELVVPVSELAETTANLTVKGTKDQIMFEEVSKYVRGEK